MLEAAEKTAIIEKFQRDESDSGSPEVQIAVLTARIQKLTKHLQAFPKDVHSRRGLYGLVSRRRRLLGYLASRDREAQRRLISELGLRG